MLEDEGVTKIIVGKVGENMKIALINTNIKLIEQAGLISEFIEKQK
jgi:predicted Fe-Mo cluster-binding NifX family protein